MEVRSIFLPTALSDREISAGAILGIASFHDLCFAKLGFPADESAAWSHLSDTVLSLEKLAEASRMTSA
jgi:hypothetical protein